jgi:hypothetical protein
MLYYLVCHRIKRVREVRIKILSSVYPVAQNGLGGAQCTHLRFALAEQISPLLCRVSSAVSPLHMSEEVCERTATILNTARPIKMGIHLDCINGFNILEGYH